MISAATVARKFQASLSGQLEGQMLEFMSQPLTVAGGKQIAAWLEDHFFFQGAKTPRGQKDLKEAVTKLYWWLKNGLAQQADPERIRSTIEASWEDVRRRLADLVKYFSSEGGRDVPKELKIGGNTYVNVSGFDASTLEKYAKRLESVFDTLKGWRKKALKVRGGVRVALAGPGDFRGTSKGKYKTDQDTLYVRATPEVLKRSGATYGSFEYIITHELGHRYQHKYRMSVDFDKPDWWTSKYSHNEGESFAELFALSNFDIKGYGSDEVLTRFENLMQGQDAPETPALPDHLKKYFPANPTWS